MENVLGARIVLFVLLLGAGILLIWLARSAASGRLKRNPLAGIRLPSTMATDEAWLAAHVRAKRPTVWAGCTFLATAAFVLLPVSDPVLSVGVLLGCLIVLVMVIHAARVGVRAAIDTSRDPDS
ncbi:SdpI family protein [Microbacterium caowuchunii]|uniref:SdpI family protein n=1 Tax=Microbacterium caowuchunii TaxID=2614638 RepID=UPI001243C119|nr:SdpI family protein [Microbacterium caowuchunii]QEV99444.1 SdpI family protein [Microbacterium caowuchunii]